MAFGRIEDYFESMRRVLEFRFILPDRRFAGGGGFPENPNFKRPTKTMIVLNGYTHNNLEWLAHTQIFDLATMYNVAVILPSGENSFYTNHEGCNDHFGDFVGRELPDYVASTFGLSADREDRSVMGLSMGGFGALHTGLAYPEHYSKITALSSALVLDEVAVMTPEGSNAGGDYAYYRRTFGQPETVLESDANPEKLILDLQAAGKEIPGLFLACGNEDFLLEPNLKFRQFLLDHGVEHQYYQSPGGHDYNFWNEYIEKAIRWSVGAEEAADASRSADWRDET